MKIIKSLSDINIKSETVLTVGSFDGIHLGHQQILEELKIQSYDCECIPTLVTFHPHPKQVLGNRVELLTPLDEKLHILEKLGLSMIIVIPFTVEFSKMDYQDFVRQILIKKLRMKKMVVGHDHAFGRNRMGDSDHLKELGINLGFSVTVIEPYIIGSELISSSRIREFLHLTEMEKVKELLGRPYSLIGIVEKGENRGAALGFPTANIQPLQEDKLIPQRGVYAVDIVMAEKTYQGMMNIGHRPTFNFDPLTLEVHIFNFSGLIYGSTIEILFKKYIREEKRFSTKQELKEQISKDKEICIKI
jgi:riboflavin kinase/FMN adenylyltransferase